MGGVSCAQTGRDHGSVKAGTKMGTGSDLDAAVLAACNFGGAGLV